MIDPPLALPTVEESYVPPVVIENEREAIDPATLPTFKAGPSTLYPAKPPQPKVQRPGWVRG